MKGVILNKTLSKVRYTIILIVILLAVKSCVYSFDPEISKYEKLIVIDGQLTNLPGPYTVKITQSYSYRKSTAEPIRNAQLKIIDDQETEIPLVETEQGVYQTKDSSFTGIIGRKYMLEIIIESEVYQSEFETLKKPIPIKNLFWKYLTQDDGIQLFINAIDSTNETRFYAWDYEEVWKFSVPVDVKEHPEWKTCYTENSSDLINIATSGQKVQDIISEQPINFISEHTNRLFDRYSINVTQYSLNESEYSFFNNLLDMNIQKGSLFDRTPSTIYSNIKCLSNNDIPVLGYFLVCGASEKRIFIDRSELPDDYNPTSGYNDCAQISIFVPIEYKGIVNNHYQVDSLLSIGYSIIYENIIAPPLMEVILNGAKPIIDVCMAKSPCYNCTLNGEIVPPEFWQEKDEKNDY